MTVGNESITKILIPPPYIVPGFEGQQDRTESHRRNDMLGRLLPAVDSPLKCASRMASEI